MTTENGLCCHDLKGERLDERQSKLAKKEGEIRDTRDGECSLWA